MIYKGLSLQWNTVVSGFRYTLQINKICSWIILIEVTFEMVVDEVFYHIPCT